MKLSRPQKYTYNSVFSLNLLNHILQNFSKLLFYIILLKILFIICSYFIYGLAYKDELYIYLYGEVSIFC